MNPYQESNASPAKPPSASNKIERFSILQAGAIYFIMSFVCAVIFSNTIGAVETSFDVAFFAVLTVLPWIVGAVYLAWNVNYRWAVHGLRSSDDTSIESIEEIRLVIVELSTAVNSTEGMENIRGYIENAKAPSDIMSQEDIWNSVVKRSSD